MSNLTTFFGRDTSCLDSLRTGRFATGARLVGEAAYRRLTTPRGMLRGGEDEANYGLDLSDYIGSTKPTQDAAALPGRITAELTKDDRIQSVTVSVTSSTENGFTSFDIVIEAVTGAGPFTLQIGIGEITVDLVGLDA